MSASQEVPPVETIALNRMAYGLRPSDVQHFKKIGLEKYIDEQLSPEDSDEPLLEEKLQKARVHIEYEAGKG